MRDKKEYSLEDYNELAYEFAIRNLEVIKLLEDNPLSDIVATKLLDTYGISIKVEIPLSEYDENGDEIMDCEFGEINSLDELYLDYSHLKGIKTPSRGSHKGFKRITNPQKNPRFMTKRFETETEAIERISTLFEARGRSNKLKRLLNGEVFTHYDAVTYDKKSIYSLDKTTNKKKTISSDIKLVNEWIKPSQYLQLLPQIITPKMTHKEGDYYQ